MTETSTTNPNVIDVTGLPPKAVEAVRAIVDALRQQTTPQQPPVSLLSPEERKRQFEEYMREVEARASLYPEGFVVDDSPETIYEGRGE